jgi:hypothetical protein
MAHYGRLATYQFPDRAEDIRGASLYGLHDEKLGKVDDVIFDHSTGNVTYLVVDTGGWLRTKRFLVPADRVRASTKHEDDFACDLNKQQIETFPPYDEKDLDSEQRWADYEGRYRSKWETSPVMHRAETDRNVTPTTQQLQGNPSSERASQGLPRSVPENRSLDPESVNAAGGSTDRVVPAGTDSVVINNGAVGIGGRWDTFQARLRERRKEAVAGCPSCTVGSASAKGSESAGTLKKAI